MFNNDDDYTNNNNNNLDQKQATNFLSSGKEINMSSTEIERRAGEFYLNTVKSHRKDVY